MNKEYRDSHLIYFGNRHESILKYEAEELRYSLGLQTIVQDHGIHQLAVLDQTHSSIGFTFDHLASSNISSWFEMSGDFLLTNQKDIALVVLTADCIPLVLYDPVHQAIALVHAGWKGSYLGVVQEALVAMQKNYGTTFSDLICTFGPSARSCCYEVSTSFVQDFQRKYEDVHGIYQKQGAWYFDNSLFLQQILKKSGILQDRIYADKAICTICSDKHCSFRREKEQAGRQVTMVALR